MLDTPKARLDVRRNSFSHRIVTTWNSLPQSVEECDSLNTVKNRKDEHFKQLGLCDSLGILVYIVFLLELCTYVVNCIYIRCIL